MDSGHGSLAILQLLTALNNLYVLNLPFFIFQIRQFSGAVCSTKGYYMPDPTKGKAGYVLKYSVVFIP